VFVLLIELIVLIAGVVVAAGFRRNRRGLLRASGFVLVAFAIIVIALAVTGWPLLQVRLRHSVMRAATVDAMAVMHRTCGHGVTTAIVFMTPIFIAAALAHRTTWRRSVHVIAAVALLLLCQFETLAGYLLPHMITTENGSSVLRFVVLHVFFLPALLIALALLLAWRHFRNS